MEFAFKLIKRIKYQYTVKLRLIIYLCFQFLGLHAIPYVSAAMGFLELWVSISRVIFQEILPSKLQSRECSIFVGRGNNHFKIVARKKHRSALKYTYKVRPSLPDKIDGTCHAEMNSMNQFGVSVSK